MVDKRLQDYISECKNKNISDEEVIKNLKNRGCSDDDIQQAFNYGKSNINTPVNTPINPQLIENSSKSNKVSHSLNIIPFLIGLVILIIISIVIFLIYNFYQEKRQNNIVSLQSVTPTLSTENNNLQGQANKFFTATKQKDADSTYKLFSLQLQKQVSKDELMGLFNELDLDEATKQTQNSLNDATFTIDSSQYQGKKYLGTIYYNSPPNGNLEISFIKVNDQWKILSFNFTRLTISDSGDLDTDLSEIKKNVSFSIYKPTYLPLNYSYDGTTILELTNQNVPDGKAHPIVLFAFSDISSETPFGGSKQILITQLNVSMDEASLLTFINDQLSPQQSAEEVQLQGGIGIYVSGGFINNLTLVKENSVITLSPDSTITKADLIKIADSLQEIP